MPLIAGMAGNTGTQSLAVVVRGLALGKLDRSTVRRLIRREAATGIMIGVRLRSCRVPALPIGYPRESLSWFCRRLFPILYVNRGHFSWGVWFP